MEYMSIFVYYTCRGILKIIKCTATTIMKIVIYIHNTYNNDLLTSFPHQGIIALGQSLY